jgi:ribosome-associated protein
LTSQKSTPSAKRAAAKKPATKKTAVQKPGPAKKAAAAKKPAEKKAAAKKPPSAPKQTAKTTPVAKPAAKKPAAAAKPAPSLGERIRTWIDADKGEEIVTIDLAGKSAMADAMIIATGRSTRHVSAMAEHVIENLKKSGAKVARAEGMARGDWVLIDAGDVIVHLFRPEVRKFYALEKLWNLDETGPDQVAVKP